MHDFLFCVGSPHWGEGGAGGEIHANMSVVVTQYIQVLYIPYCPSNGFNSPVAAMHACMMFGIRLGTPLRTLRVFKSYTPGFKDQQFFGYNDGEWWEELVRLAVFTACQ